MSETSSGGVAGIAVEGPHPGTEAAGPAELGAAPGDHGPVQLAGHGDSHGHPTPLKYIGVALTLAFVTALEVGLYYIEMADGLMVFILMTLALVKFVFVAAYFMHLKFDNKVLRRFFITGIILAMFCYFIVLITLDVLFG